jgi:phosphate uptake regulator
MKLKDLLSMLRGEEPLQDLGQRFLEMMALCEEMYRKVNVAFWAGQLTEELRTETYRRDVQLNKLERAIRKDIVQHLALATDGQDAPYCVVLLNVVKDAERIGDYTKNIAEIPVISTISIPEGPLRTELREIGVGAESLLHPVARTFHEGDRREAEQLIRRGRELGQRADGLLPRVAHAGLGSEATTTIVLMTRFYKRITGHTVNILSSVVMPVHKIDFFDEEELEKLRGEA